MESEKNAGVWALYFYDTQAIVVSVHRSSEEAAMFLDYGESIFWWPFGMRLHDALELWDHNKKSVRDQMMGVPNEG